MPCKAYSSLRHIGLPGGVEMRRNSLKAREAVSFTDVRNRLHRRVPVLRASFLMFEMDAPP